MGNTIGDRIDVENHKDRVEINIYGKIKGWQESLLFAWVLMWSLCGIYVAIFFFQPLQFEEKLFLMAYMAFWAYFEYMAVRTWVWRKWGFEKIIVSAKELHIEANLKTFGKPKTYFTENIKDFGLTQKENAFTSSYFNSFWILGGEKLTFNYMGKDIVFGKQLKEEEARRLASVIRRYFKRKK